MRHQHRRHAARAGTAERRAKSGLERQDNERTSRTLALFLETFGNEKQKVLRKNVVGRACDFLSP